MRLLIISFCLLLLAGCGQPINYTLNSPDGALAVTLSLNDQGQPAYQVSNKGFAVLNTSRLQAASPDGEYRIGYPMAPLYRFRSRPTAVL